MRLAKDRKVVRAAAGIEIAVVGADADAVFDRIVQFLVKNLANEKYYWGENEISGAPAPAATVAGKAEPCGTAPGRAPSSS